MELSKLGSAEISCLIRSPEESEQVRVVLYAGLP